MCVCVCVCVCVYVYAVCFAAQSVMSNSVIPWTVAHQAPLSMEILQARILEWVAVPSSRGSSQPRDWTQVSCIAGRFFTSEPPRKPKNTGVGSLSLLQGIIYMYTHTHSHSQTYTLLYVYVYGILHREFVHVIMRSPKSAMWASRLETQVSWRSSHRNGCRSSLKAVWWRSAPCLGRLVFLFYSDLQLIAWGLSVLWRAICFTRSSPI